MDDENVPNVFDSTIDSGKENASCSHKENFKFDHFGEVETLLQCSEHISDMESDRESSPSHIKPVSSRTHLSCSDVDELVEPKNVDGIKPTKISIGSTFTDLFQDKVAGVAAEQLKSDYNEKDGFVTNLTSPNYPTNASITISCSHETRTSKVMTLL